jgi:hypothetical protein
LGVITSFYAEELYEFIDNNLAIVRMHQKIRIGTIKMVQMKEKNQV